MPLFVNAPNGLAPQELRKKLRPLKKWLSAQKKRFKRYPVLDLRHDDIEPLDALSKVDGKPVLISVRLDHCRWSGPTGFPYGPDSPHPYVHTLLQYRKHGMPALGESYLAQYYASFQPSSLAEFQGIETECHPLLLSLRPLKDTYPWSPFSVSQLQELRSDAGNAAQRHRPSSCGPRCDDFVQARLDTLVALFDAVQSKGFRTEPSLKLPYFDQFPTGDVMVRGKETRIILANGQHRASVLSALGKETMPLIIGVVHSRGPFKIDRAASAEWPLVRSGLYSEIEALQIFDGIFDANGPGPRKVA